MTDELQFLDALNAKGTVFLVRQPATGRILTGRRVPAPQAEVYTALQQSRPPHVPRVRAVQPEPDGQFLILQDYIQGITLETVLARQHSLPWQQVVAICIQLCKALESLHTQKLVHRDIKPGNVLLTETGQAWLIDFDISRTCKDTQPRDTALLGTMGYAAPEQFGFQQTDARADLYALGVLLNQLCTGDFPQNKPVEGPLAKIVQKCIEIDPRQRYESAAALRRALEYLCPEAAVPSVETPAAPPPKPAGVPGFRSGNPLHILIAILVYGVFAIFALAVGLASFSSFSNFVVGATVLLGPVGCYLFAFDLFNIRTRCTLVERFRHTKQYPFYCVCVMLSWLLLCFFVMFLGVGVLDSKK